jgi:hypothetical protein
VTATVVVPSFGEARAEVRSFFTVIKSGACGAAGPAPAPGSAFERPARRMTGHTTQAVVIKAARTACRPVPDAAIALGSRLSSSRPPRQWRSLPVASHAIGYTDH